MSNTTGVTLYKVEVVDPENGHVRRGWYNIRKRVDAVRILEAVTNSDRDIECDVRLLSDTVTEEDVSEFLYG